MAQIKAGNPTPLKPSGSESRLWSRVVMTALYAAAAAGFLYFRSAPTGPTSETSASSANPQAGAAPQTSATIGGKPNEKNAPRPTVGQGRKQFHDTPWGTRIFQQRECQGIDDCTEANIEREQTEASRMLNRMSRTSIRRAVELLGQPHYVLRAGDKVPVHYYENNVTERGFAHAVIMWTNGSCAPNSVHVTSSSGMAMATPDPGGAECTLDGKPFPVPTDAFSCAKGRKGDPLCKLENVLRLPGM